MKHPLGDRERGWRSERGEEGTKIIREGGVVVLELVVSF